MEREGGMRAERTNDQGERKVWSNIGDSTIEG